MIIFADSNSRNHYLFLRDMKKFSSILAALALMAMVATPAFAQKKKSKSASSPFYVGGSVGLTFSTANDGNGNGEQSKQSGVSYRFLPEFGYRINKNLAVGLQVGAIKGIASLCAFDPSDLKGIAMAAASAYLDISSDVNFNAGGGGAMGGNGGPMKVTAFRFAPYARYSIFSTKVFDFFVDGTISYTRAAQKTYGPDPNGPGNIWQGTNYNLIEVSARPGFLVKFTPRFNVICRIASIGVQSVRQQDSQAGITRFGLDMDSGTLLLGFVMNL